MGKKRVPISLRKPPSPEAAAQRANDLAAPEADPPAPAPEVVARVAEPEVVAPAAAPEIVACAPPPAPAVTAPVIVEPVVTARVAEPEAPAPIAEPMQALQVTKEASPAIVVGADGRTMRAVTIYLPAELVDRLMLYCMEQGRDVLREAIEASLDKRLGQGAPAPAAAAEAARASASQHSSARRIAERVERWLDLGRTLVQSLRGYVRSPGAAVGVS